MKNTLSSPENSIALTQIRKSFLTFVVSCICYASYAQNTTVNPNLNYGFTGRGPIPWNATAKVLGSSKIIATDVHVYFISKTDNKIYDIAWDGTSWHGYNVPLVSSQPPVVTGTQIVNDGNLIYFVGNDYFIYQLKFITGPGWVCTKLVPNQTKVKSGTDIVYSDKHIYYVNLNNKICDISDNGASWIGGNQLSAGQTVDVKTNTQLIKTDVHVYFIGNDDRIYDIVQNAAGNWINGGWPLDMNAPKVYAGTTMTNDFNHLFYINQQKKICEMLYTNGIGWKGNVVNTTNVVDPANPSNGLTYFDTHVYYVSDISSIVCDIVYDLSLHTWSGALLSYDQNTPKVHAYSKLLTWSNQIYEEGTNNYFTSHHIFYFDVNNVVNFFIWDDKKCDYRAFGCWDPKDSNHDGSGWDYPPTGSIYDSPNGPNTSGYHCVDCQGKKTWHQGHLNNTSLPADYTIAMTNFDKHFYYVGSDNLIHDFLRSPINGTDYKNWDHFYANEFTGTGAFTDPLWRKDFHWGNHNPNACYDIYWNEESNVYLNNDKLVFEAERVIPSIQHELIIEGSSLGMHDYNLLTGMMTSEVVYPDDPQNPVNLQFLYGYAEIRCKLPRGKYFWPAFWLTSNTVPQEDINVFEEDGNGKSLISTAYSSTQWNDAITSYAVGYRFHDDFYTYAVEWDPDWVRYYINNEEVGHIVNTANSDHVIHFTLELHEVMGSCDLDNFPNYFEVDYLRIWQDPNLHRHAGSFNSGKPYDVSTIIAEEGKDFVNTNTTDIKNIYVFDVSGKQVMSSTDQNISTAGLRKGIYFMNVYRNDNSKKIIKLVKM